MYKSLQACRGLAAFQVLLFHLGGLLAATKYFDQPALARFFCFGDSGVELFFVLSGFIIFWVYRRDVGRPAALPAYLVKRLIRIYPTYWIVFLGVAMLAWTSPALRSGVPATLGLLIRSLLLLPQDPAAVGGTGAPVLIVAWTLQYEMLFYAVFAAIILHRAAIPIIAILSLGNMAFCADGCAFPASFLSREPLLLFAFGAAIAWLSDGRLLLKRPIALVLLGVLGYGVLVAGDIMTWKSPYAMHRPIAYGIVFAVLILGLVQAENRGQVLGGGKSLQWLGDSSYALYLIHFPLLSALCKVALAIGLAGVAGAALAFALMLSVTVACAVLFHLWLERPMLRRLAALTARLTASARTPAPAPVTSYPRGAR